MTWTQLHALPAERQSLLGRAGHAGGIAGVPLGDLFALSNAIAGVVGGAVTIEDPEPARARLLDPRDQPIDAARRGSILGRQVPDSPGMRALYRQVLSSTGVMTADTPTLRAMLEGDLADTDDLKPRSAVAIRAGSQAIGSIWVVHDEDRLDEESERALAEAARIAAPHVIQARAARDVERRMRAEMLLTVLDGRGSAEETAATARLLRRRAALGRGVRARRRRAGIDELRRERLVDLVVVHCEASFRQTAAVALGQTVYALLQDGARARPGGGSRLAHRIAHARGGAARHAAARGRRLDGGERPRGRPRATGGRACPRRAAGRRAGAHRRLDRGRTERGGAARAARAERRPSGARAREARSASSPTTPSTAAGTRPRCAPTSTRSGTCPRPRPGSPSIRTRSATGCAASSSCSGSTSRTPDERLVVELQLRLLARRRR